MKFFLSDLFVPCSILKSYFDRVFEINTADPPTIYLVHSEGVMETDAALYNIRKFPIVYYYYVLRFASNILLYLTRDEFAKNKLTRDSFKEVCYLWVEEPFIPEDRNLIKTIARNLIDIYARFEKADFLNLTSENQLAALRLKEYLKLIALLEFYGYLCQSPGSLKIRKDKICLNFLSEWAKKVIVSATVHRVRKSVWISFHYSDFSIKERDFVLIKKESSRKGRLKLLIKNGKVCTASRR